MLGRGLVVIALCGIAVLPAGAQQDFKDEVRKLLNDGIDLYIWLKPASTTAQNVKGNPHVGFAIDEYSPDWRQTKGVQGSGKCEVVTGEAIASTAMKFGEKFPDLSPGGSTASISFYRISPDELQFIDNSGSEKSADEFGFSYRSDRVYTGVGESVG